MGFERYLLNFSGGGFILDWGSCRDVPKGVEGRAMTWTIDCDSRKGGEIAMGAEQAVKYDAMLVKSRCALGLVALD